MENTKPTNSFVGPLLNDMYQISMTYAHWKSNKVHDEAVFDLFFRKNPFSGEFTVFAGIDEVVKLLASFRFEESDIDYLKTLLPQCELEFWEYLRLLDCSNIRLFSMSQGEIVFPREPLIRVEGPLGVAQLLETTLLNLINYPSLIATNAARMRLAAGNKVRLLEFGLRRAQGPDGAISASKYSYVGGFDGTSNVLAGKLFGMAVKGTHAHAYVMCYSGLHQLNSRMLAPAPAAAGVAQAGGSLEVDFASLAQAKYRALGFTTANEGELAAFISFAQAFPSNMLALVDTYDTLTSGVPNFLAVGWALHELGYKPMGIRLDSGDLAYLSKATREMFIQADAVIGCEVFTQCNIVASNDINEDVLLSMATEGHEINTFGIGTNLVTCQKQPALGCVYKLVEINGEPRIKLSQDTEKLVIPGKKSVYRLIGKNNFPIVDIMQHASDGAPQPGQPLLCRHPFAATKRANVTPTAVECLLHLVWDGANGGLQTVIPSLQDARTQCSSNIHRMRHDHIRSLNPTPFKVSVSNRLFDFMHELWMREAPVADLS